MRAVPDDLAERAATSRIYDLLRHYQVARPTLQAWFAAAGIKREPLPGGIAATPVPYDFAERRETMTIRELGEHYDVGKHLIRRWMDVLGIPRQRKTGKPKRVKTASPFTAGVTRLGAVDRAQRDYTPAGQAADYLRHYGPVVRCDPSGRYAEHGSHWRLGWSVLTADEIVARADEKREREARLGRGRIAA